MKVFNFTFQKIYAMKLKKIYIVVDKKTKENSKDEPNIKMQIFLYLNKKKLSLNSINFQLKCIHHKNLEV